MKKNLVYYSMGLDPNYFEMFKLSLESLDKSNSETFDVLVITDQSFYDQHFVNFERTNLYFHITKQIENTDHIGFNKLEIFSWNKISEYENALFLDSAVIVNTEIKKIFDRCENPNKIYAPIEDMSFDNHRRIYFSLGDYTEDDINFFRLNNIHTFNTGMFMFKISDFIKLHFSNIKRIILGHKGDYFAEQSFMNYYFNKMKMVDYDVLKSEGNVILVVQNNFYNIEEFDDKMFYLIGSINKGDEKFKKLNEFFQKVFPSEKKVENINLNKNLIHITKVSDDRKNFHFKSDISMRCHLIVFIETKVIYEQTFDLTKDIVYWVSLNDGFSNKKIQFMNEFFYQDFIFHGKSEILKKELIYRELKYKYSELSNLYKTNHYEEYKKRRKYIDYYYELFITSNFKKYNILETEVLNTENISFWNHILPNSKLITTTSDSDLSNLNEEVDIFYFNKTQPKTLKLLFDNKNLSFSYDLIILKDLDTLLDKNYFKEFVEKLVLGGSIIVENIGLDSIEKFEMSKKKIDDFEKYYFSEIICFDESYDSKSEIIIKITKKL
jgi:hypothetical protein